MSFTTFNLINASHKPQPKMYGQATLYMSAHGCFRLSQRASAILKLTDKDRIEFLQDDAYPTDWYIQKVDNKFGFPLRSDVKGNLCFITSGIRDMLLKTVIKNALLQFRCVLFDLTPTSDGKLAINTKTYRVSKTRIKNGQ
jgi:hypothetical protein